VAAAHVSGYVKPEFERVADAFAENFALRRDIGAAFAATLDGQTVVDLWGGVADSASDRPWQQDTMQLIFSGTKGLTSLCVAMLIDRGLLALEDPVCSHWPEFAAHGKEAITVAEVLSHRARLPGVRTPLNFEDVLDPQAVEALIAGQAQESDPRADFIYHARTLGWICDALIRRVDGRSTGQFLAEEISGPLGLDLWIGLPAEQEPRVAVLQYSPNWGQSVYGQADSSPFPDDDLWASISENPMLYPAGELPWNLPALHAAEIPSSNAIGTARSIARLYGALACGGEIDGVRIISPETIALVSAPAAAGPDPFSGTPMAYSAGFELQTTARQFGPAKSAFGFTGTGGGTHGAWPQERVGFSYAMNELRDDLSGDERVGALLDVLHACLGAEATPATAAG
jgi:CubicO group peptidase (beta-lactamase class C family)